MIPGRESKKFERNFYWGQLGIGQGGGEGREAGLGQFHTVAPRSQRGLDWGAHFSPSPNPWQSCRKTDRVRGASGMHCRAGEPCCLLLLPC